MPGGRGRPGRDDARLPARTLGCADPLGGKARRLFPRFPRGHGASSTTELLAELGFLDEFLQRVPHQNVDQLGMGFKGRSFDLIDFRHLPTACKYVVFMPQWDFLNFLADKANHYPTSGWR